MYHGEEFMAIKKNADIEINEQIRDKEVRVIGANGDQLGVMSSKEAYMMAKDADLDLIRLQPMQRRLLSRLPISVNIAMR